VTRDLLPRISVAARGDLGILLSAAAWVARFVGLLLVGLLTFVNPPTEAGGESTQSVIYVVACFAILGWLVVDLWPGLPVPVTGLLLRGCLGLVIVSGAVGASAGGTGDCLIALSIGALVIAGSEFDLMVVLVLAALGVLAVEVGAIVFGQGVGTVFGFPLLLVIGLLVGRNRASFRVQVEQAAALLARQEQLQAEQRWADVLDERARIAREIHDVLAHSLGALGIQIQTARAFFSELNDPDRALEVLATAQRMAADGLAETRRAVLALRADFLPLPEELARAAREHAEVHGVKVDWAIHGERRPVPPDATIALLRTARECLVNAAKHAPGQAVDIRLDYGADHLRLTVATALPDGPDARGSGHTGPDAPSPGPGVLQTVDGGYGLTGVRERMRLLRGSLEVGPRGRQWVVDAELPLAPQAPRGDEG
jgi:signal transduction histidine kinase